MPTYRELAILASIIGMVVSLVLIGAKYYDPPTVPSGTVQNVEF